MCGKASAPHDARSRGGRRAPSRTPRRATAGWRPPPASPDVQRASIVHGQVRRLLQIGGDHRDARRRCATDRPARQALWDPKLRVSLTTRTRGSAAASCSSRANEASSEPSSTKTNSCVDLGVARRFLGQPGVQRRERGLVAVDRDDDRHRTRHRSPSTHGTTARCVAVSSCRCALERAYRFAHDVDLVVGEPRVHRQRQQLAGGALGDREGAARIAEVGVDRVQVHRRPGSGRRWLTPRSRRNACSASRRGWRMTNR